MIGMKQRDVARGPMRKVPAANRLVSVYCGPHGKKGRRLNAVVTKQGRLLTTVEDVSYVDPGDDRVMAPCDLCPMHRDGRSLSVRKLKACVAAGAEDVAFDQVLA